MISKVLTITRYYFLKLKRDFRSYSMMFVLPIVFMGVFGFIFQADSDDGNQFDIGYINQNITEADKEFIKSLETLENSKDNQLLILEEFENSDAATTAINDEEIAAYLEINTEEQRVELYGDQASPLYTVLAGIVRDFSATAFQKDNSYFEAKSVQIAANDDIEMTGFDLLAPGLVIYSMIIFSAGIAQDFTKIRESGEIFRYKTTQISAGHIIAGTSIYFITVVLLQTIISLLTAQFFGLNVSGSIWSSLYIAAPFSLFVVGIGMLIGSTASSAETAANTASIVGIILGFLSGSFIAGVGNLYTFELFGTEYQFNDVLPSKWAIDAMNKLIVQDLPLSEITNSLAGITIVGILLFALGAWVYERKEL